MSHKVFIPTAGLGTRLGELTEHLNKTLVSVANRPVISHIIEQFPEDVEFIIALGYRGSLVREFLEIAYPSRTFIFHEVSPYEGPGSGLGYTILSCHANLQEPFIFCSCDTIVKNDIPKPDHNWMGYATVDDLSRYRTIRLFEDRVTDICDKGIVDERNKAYIGLAGIFDYDLFWDTMGAGGEYSILTGESYGMRSLIPKDIRVYKFDWYDTGNLDSLEKARNSLRAQDNHNLLEKTNEAIWFVGNSVIKFSTDSEFISNRVKRSRYLKGYCPQPKAATEHMYRYEIVKGKILSDIVTLPLFRKLLNVAEGFWKRKQLCKEDYIIFKRACLQFYKEKTYDRVNLFYEKFGKGDNEGLINGTSMPSLDTILNQVDWEWLSEGLPGRYHGDFHFENILYDSDSDKFTFLDWRQEFCGDLEVGDIYYDIAKLNHGLIICHESIAKGLFTVQWNDGEITYDFHRKQVLIDCEKELLLFLERRGYDVQKVILLAALIFLNIAALHHYPYCLLLYALGKLLAYKCVSSKQYLTYSLKR